MCQEEHAATGNELVEAVRKHVRGYYSTLGETIPDPVVVVSAKLESEASQRQPHAYPRAFLVTYPQVSLLEEEGGNKELFLSMYGLTETGTDSFEK